MKTLRKSSKPIAAFLILNMLFTIAWPGISWALTSGPTAPEYSSFEPFDTSDMVNLSTGDFVYNMPLLDVPGPAGGFPVSMAYHAGIKPDLEASWTGLGWNLNVGAINRIANGIPDDFESQKDGSRSYWAGGTRTDRSYGVTLGIAGLPGIMAGLTFANDTYEGKKGVGGYIGTTASAGSGAIGASASFRLNFDPMGGVYTSVGLGAGIGKATQIGTFSASAGYNLNLRAGKVSGSASVGLNAGNLLGASISSASNKAVISAVGVTKTVQNSNAGLVSTFSDNEGVSIPLMVLPLSIDISKTHTRYWIDQTNETRLFGSLYFPESLADADKDVTDVRYLFDDLTDRSVERNSTPGKELGGSIPEYDNYTVKAQGITGNIRPHLFQKYIFDKSSFWLRKNKKDETVRENEVIHYQFEQTGNKPHFRYMGDFSNAMDFPSADLTVNASGAPQYSFSGITATDFEDNNLRGSRIVNYFTNKEIKEGTATKQGFIDTDATGFARDDADSSKIGGYMITNATGVTYHFALPVYNYDEYRYSRNKQEPVLSFNELYRPAKYAYNWLLTAITGPDFYDANGNKEVDENDWGYWVKFDYGRWTSTFQWRTPSHKYTTDIDNRFENFSQGVKELYYLDAIKTKTHTALFVKDIRYDGRGLNYLPLNRMGERGWPEWTRRPDDAIDLFDGSYVTRPSTIVCQNKEDPTPGIKRGLIDLPGATVRPLALDKIVLVKNEDLPGLDKSRGSEWENNWRAAWLSDHDEWVENNCRFCFQQTGAYPEVRFEHQQYQNVFDKFDYAEIESVLKPKALRIVDLSYDYELQPFTPNSYTSCSNDPLGPEDCLNYAYGKLTLQQIDFQGKGGASIMPATRFEYDLDFPLIPSPVKNIVQGQLQLTIDEFTDDFMQDMHAGEIVTFVADGKRYYASVSSNGSDWIKIRTFYGGDVPGNATIQNLKRTKNPPYQRGFKDMWNMYKNDVDSTILEHGILARRPSDESAGSTDSWSLRTIHTPLGADVNIQYEADRYERAELSKQQLFNIKEVVPGTDGQSVEIALFGIPGKEISDFIKVNDRIDLSVVSKYPMADHQAELSCSPGLPEKFVHSLDEESEVYVRAKDAAVASIDAANSKIVVTDPDFYNAFKYDFNFWVYEGDRCSGTNFKLIRYEGTGVLPEATVGGALHVAFDDEAGGDIRVKSISLAHDNKVNTTHYYYSGGTSSYEPVGILKPQLNPDYTSANPVRSRNLISKAVLDNYSALFSNAALYPAPGVMYSQVETGESYTNQQGVETTIPGHTVYRFKTFSKGMIGVIEEAYTEGGAMSVSQYVDKITKSKLRKLAIKDYSADIGQVESISLFDKRGGKLISRTNYTYLSDIAKSRGIDSNDPGIPDDLEVYADNYEPLLQDRFNNQGLIRETFVEGRYVRQPNRKEFHLLGTSASFQWYPNILMRVETKNYRTGLSTSEYNLAFDFLSGAPVKVLSNDAYGRYVLKEEKPAYHVSDYSVMKHKNMLSQSAGSYTWLVTSSAADDIQESDLTRLGLAGASVQTWGDNVPTLGAVAGYDSIYRMRNTYVLQQAVQDDGLIAPADVPAFHLWNSDTDDPHWRLMGGIKLYDLHSHALEATDVNGVKSASHYDCQNHRLLSSVTVGGYNDFGHCTFEQVDGCVPNIVTFTPVKDAAHSHSGVYCGKLTGSSTLLVDKDNLTAGNYKISVWVHEHNASKFTLKSPQGLVQTSAQITENLKAGNFYLVTLLAHVTDGNLQISLDKSGIGSVYVDDLRYRPVASAMQSVVYNAFEEISYIIGENDLYSHFEYDELGRLTAVHAERMGHGPKLVSTSAYHLKQ